MNYYVLNKLPAFAVELGNLSKKVVKVMMCYCVWVHLGGYCGY